MAKKKRRSDSESKKKLSLEENRGDAYKRSREGDAPQVGPESEEWVVPAVRKPTQRSSSALREATALVAEQDSWEAFDFDNGAGVTKARRHRNPDGSLGGWVEDGAIVAPSVTLGRDVWVYEQATVWDAAQIGGRVHVRGSALIFGSPIISGNALIEDEANVYGAARVIDSAHLKGKCAVFGNATVGGNAIIAGQAYVLGNAHITDNVRVGGSCTIRGSSYLKGNLKLVGELDLNGNIQMGGNFELSGKCVFVGDHIIVTQPHPSEMESGVYGYSRGHAPAKVVASRLFGDDPLVSASLRRP